MRDHHVDRPEVEAGQPAQLTGTNRSIGFPRPTPSGKPSPAEPLFRRGDRRSAASPKARDPARPASRWSNDAPDKGPGPIKEGGKPSLQKDTRNSLRPAGRRTGPRVKPGAALDQPLAKLARSRAALDGLVAIARGITPDPIPNSAVKTLCADGTAPQGAEE